jgi:hypothetical protein
MPGYPGLEVLDSATRFTTLQHIWQASKIYVSGTEDKAFFGQELLWFRNRIEESFLWWTGASNQIIAK